MSLSDSDVEEGVKKVSLAHEGYQIPNSSCKQDIEKFYDDIHTNIEDLNTKLIGLFKKKEDDLCNMYKREMTKAQKRLRELQECTSEQELNKRKIEKKEKLQKERQKFLETSIFFSNQCKEFKTTLTKVINTTKDLESEINFLNEQIVFADRHNEKLSSELDSLKAEIHKYDPTLKLDNIEDILAVPPKIHASESASTSQQQQQQLLRNSNQSLNDLGQQSQLQLGRSSQLSQYISPYSKRQIMKPNIENADFNDLAKAKAELKRQREINAKLSEFLNDPCFQETEFERIFMDCVISVRQKKIQQNTANKLPYVKTKETSSIQQQNEASIANESTLDFTTISDLDFNEFQKRSILEEFLSKEEIKKYLYTLIFANNTNKQANKTANASSLNASKNTIQKKNNENKYAFDPQDQNQQSNFLDELKKS